VRQSADRRNPSGAPGNSHDVSLAFTHVPCNVSAGYHHGWVANGACGEETQEYLLSRIP
jgi:hypothetical protein